MKIKFTVNIKDENFSYNKSHTSNVNSLNINNIEKWAFENFKVTIMDTFNYELAIADFINSVVEVKYETNECVYEYIKDAESNNIHYYINKHKQHVYYADNLFTDDWQYYLDLGGCEDDTCDGKDENIGCDKNGNVNISDPNKFFEQMSTFAKDKFGIDINNNFNVFDLFNSVINSEEFNNLNKLINNDKSTEENNTYDENGVTDEAITSNFDNKNEVIKDDCSQTAMSLKDIILNNIKNNLHDDQDEYDLASSLEAYIIDKITKLDYRYVIITDDYKDYDLAPSVRLANGILINIEDIDVEDMSESVMKHVIDFAKSENFSNVLFQRLNNNSFNIIFKL